MKRRSSQEDAERLLGDDGPLCTKGCGGATAATAALEQEEPMITTPLVFQCLKCRHVLGDSFRMLSSDEATRTVTLSGATHITKDSRQIVSTSGPDRGSSFTNLSCRHCKTVVGKYYTATSRSLSSLLGVFTLNTDTISSHQLGSYDVHDAPLRESHDVSFSKKQEPPVHGAPAGEGAQVPTQAPPERDELLREMAKMEGVILALHDRILHLEGINRVPLVGMSQQDSSGQRRKEGISAPDRSRRESSGTPSAKLPRSGRRKH